MLLFFNRAKNSIAGSRTWDRAVFLISIPLVPVSQQGPGYDRAYGGLHSSRTTTGSANRRALSVRVDGLALVLVMPTTLLGVISVVCSWAYIREKAAKSTA
jgi:NADH:ubiquinone oxidoreductase subunit 4 (subunit M)